MYLILSIEACEWKKRKNNKYKKCLHSYVKLENFTINFHGLIDARDQ